MACKTFKLSAHGTIKMFLRDIDVEDALDIAQHGTTLFEYPNDKPYPSRLVLGWIKKSDSLKPFHVVLAEDKTNNACIIITAYWPDETIWNKDFNAKK